jgi:hypothetical protein
MIYFEKMQLKVAKVGITDRLHALQVSGLICLNVVPTPDLPATLGQTPLSGRDLPRDRCLVCPPDDDAHSYDDRLPSQSAMYQPPGDSLSPGTRRRMVRAERTAGDTTAARTVCAHHPEPVPAMPA